MPLLCLNSVVRQKSKEPSAPPHSNTVLPFLIDALCIFKRIISKMIAAVARFWKGPFVSCKRSCIFKWSPYAKKELSYLLLKYGIIWWSNVQFGLKLLNLLDFKHQTQRRNLILCRSGSGRCCLAIITRTRANRRRLSPTAGGSTTRLSWPLLSSWSAPSATDPTSATPSRTPGSHANEHK